MYTGEAHKYASLQRRCIYQVIAKDFVPDSSFSTHRYRLRLVFDMESPMGHDLNSVTHLGTRDLRKLSLLDVCTVRLHLDAFLREWARQMGERDPDDVR